MALQGAPSSWGSRSYRLPAAWRPGCSPAVAAHQPMTRRASIRMRTSFGHLQHMRGISLTLYLEVRRKGVDLLELRGCQLHTNCAQVLLELDEPAGAGQRHD